MIHEEEAYKRRILSLELKIKEQTNKIEELEEKVHGLEIDLAKREETNREEAIKMRKLQR